MSPGGGVFLVDDDPCYLNAMESFLGCAGVSPVMVHGSGTGVLERIAAVRPEVVCLDLDLGCGFDGRQLINTLRMRWPEIRVVVVSGIRDSDVVGACKREGAVEYLAKPFEPGALLDVVRRFRSDDSESGAGIEDDAFPDHDAFASILTRSETMREVFRHASSIASSSLPILVTGESGTGKELMARALHDLRIPDGPFVAVNAAGLDDAVFADTLFGHAAGAFTGGEKPRAGLLEAAGEGTLFLDEIGDLSSPSQVKLLRLLQEGEYYPIGSDRVRRCRCRFVLATNHDIAESPTFRKDLYWRLGAHRIHLPPLRERPEDIELLCRHFVEEAARDLKRAPPIVDAEYLRELGKRAFPGNVRELRGFMHDQVARCRGGRLGERRTPIPSDARPGGGAAEMDDGDEGFRTLSEVQSDHIAKALARTGGNRSAAAGLLGVSRQTLFAHIRKDERFRRIS